MIKRKRENPVVIPPIEIIKSPDFKVIYSTGIFGSIAPNDARIFFFIDRLEPEMKKDQPGAMQTKKVNREMQVEVHMTPYQFKSLMLWAIQHVKIYEEKFGEIQMGKPPVDQPNLSHIS
jgi:hypothetical protein